MTELDQFVAMLDRSRIIYTKATDEFTTGITLDRTEDAYVTFLFSSTDGKLLGTEIEAKFYLD